MIGQISRESRLRIRHLAPRQHAHEVGAPSAQKTLRINFLLRVSDQVGHSLTQSIPIDVSN